MRVDAMRIITTFLVILGLVGPASAQWIGRVNDSLALYVNNPARSGTEKKYCVAGLPPLGLPMGGLCEFDDVDSCVKAARNLRHTVPAALCEPNKLYRPSEKE